MNDHGSNKRNEEIMKRLSNGEQLTVQDIIGDGYEPQGTVLLYPKMEYTKLILEAKKEHLWEGKIFTCVGVTPTGDYLALFNNGGVMDYATIDKRDVKQYAPIKNVDGLLVPINLDDIEEKIYIKNAKENNHHNKEIAELLASEKYDDTELFKALRLKYR